MFITPLQRLRTAATNRLLVPSVRFSTVGNFTFPVADQQARNDLPGELTSASSFFRQRISFILP
jgi:hypothetical protein